MAISNYSSVRSFFSLDGKPFALHAFEGGVIDAAIVKDSPGSDLAMRKRLATVNYGDLILETGVSDEIIDLIKKAWADENLRFTGCLLTTNANFKVVEEDIFSDSQVIETIIPQCDGASKEAAFFRLRIRPSLIQNKKVYERVIPLPMKVEQKRMMKANFRFELGKLPCSRVAVVDSFSVAINAIDGLRRNRGSLNITAHPIDFPNLFLTISSADLKDWSAWHKNFLIDGNNSSSDELSGRLVFLAPNFRDELLSIKLEGVGIFSLQRHAITGDKISRFRVGLYCQKMLVET